MAPELDVFGIDALAWAGATARVLPTALLVPAFGLRFLPASMRFGIAAALALAVIPAVQPSGGPGGAWALALISEFARGLPIALASAAALYASTMAGGLIDDLRAFDGSSRSLESPTSTLFALLAAIAFLETGGPHRIVSALTRSEAGPTLARAAFGVADAIAVAVAIAAPLIVLAIVLDAASALMVRATGTSFPSGFMPSLRSLVVLAGAGIVFERLAEMIVEITSRPP